MEAGTDAHRFEAQTIEWKRRGIMPYSRPTKKHFRKLKLREKLLLQQMHIKELQKALTKTEHHDYWEKQGEIFVPRKE